MNKEELNEALKIIHEPITVNSVEYKYFDVDNYNKLVNAIDYCHYLYDNVKPYVESEAKEINRLNNIINELEKMVNDFDVFKEFTFPLMKKDEEHQVKSSIDYEWRKSIKEPFLDKLKELKEGGK